MTTPQATLKNVSRVATGAIATFGTTSHKLIASAHAGGNHLNAAFTRRWNAALKESSPQLSAETRRNAAHAQKVFSGYCTRGLDLSAGGAKAVVDTLVSAALTTTERATAFAEAGLRKAG